MSERPTTAGLGHTLVTELGSAVSTASNRLLTAVEGPAMAAQGWGTPVTASGVLDGTLTLWIDDAGVHAIARQMTSLDEAPEPAVAVDMLRELWSQAASATTLAGPYAGLTLVVGAPSPGALPAAVHGYALRDGVTPMAAVVVSGSLTAGTTAAGSPAPTGARRSAGGGALPGNLAALLDVDLPLVVRFARTEMSLRALAQLGPGSMVDMGRSPDAPVQLLVGSQVIAEGEVVVVSGNYGVRITTLVSPADRLKAMEL